MLLHAMRWAIDFFVRWFLPLPALDEIREADEQEEEDARGTGAGVPAERQEMPPPVPPIPPEPAPEIRAPEGAEDRASRGSIINPFE